MENLKAGKPDESDSPKVNGYGFVVTPSPMPAPEDDPVCCFTVSRSLIYPTIFVDYDMGIH